MNKAASRNPNSSMWFFAILIAMGLAYFAFAYVQLGIHAPIRHGVEGASSVSQMFTKPGKCSEGPSVEMKSLKNGRWYYICFLKKGQVAIWVLTAPIIDLASKEVTAIPPEDILKPINYITSIISRDNMVMTAFYGLLPDWFLLIVGGG